MMMSRQRSECSRSRWISSGARMFCSSSVRLAVSELRIFGTWRAWFVLTQPCLSAYLSIAPSTINAWFRVRTPTCSCARNRSISAGVIAHSRESPKNGSEIKTIYQDIVAAIALRTVHEVLEADQRSYIDVVSFNGFVQAVDAATGKDVRSHLVTVQKQVMHFTHETPLASTT
jgi:hypothetical protein